MIFKRQMARGEGGDRGQDGWMASLTQWTGVWASSGRWWWTGRSGVLQSMWSQRVRHDGATEPNWTELRLGLRNLGMWAWAVHLRYKRFSQKSAGVLAEEETLPWARWCNKLHSTICIVLLSECFPEHVAAPGWHHWLDGHEFEQAPGVGDGQGSLVYCSPWGCKEWTRLNNWTELGKL